jgi:hypothetical protein
MPSPLGNLDHFDPYSASARSATHAPAKAALELALLCHCSARLPAHDERLGEATALVRTLWQHPDFPRLFDAHPEHASSYGLIYAALAPDGIVGTQRRAALARLAPGFLSPLGKSPYERLEIRYYADKAGVRHGIEPYAELAERSRLVKLPDAAPENAAPLTTQEAYAVTHSSFYLGDFGRTGPGLAGDALARARDLVCRMLDHCVEHDRWDLAAELVITQFILGIEPLRTPSGSAAVECLVRAQRPDGAIPARSAALRAAGPLPAGAFFRKAYHTTLVTALMALIVCSERSS